MCVVCIITEKGKKFNKKIGRNRKLLLKLGKNVNLLEKCFLKNNYILNFLA